MIKQILNRFASVCHCLHYHAAYQTALSDKQFRFFLRQGLEVDMIDSPKPSGFPGEAVKMIAVMMMLLQLN